MSGPQVVDPNHWDLRSCAETPHTPHQKGPIEHCALGGGEDPLATLPHGTSGQATFVVERSLLLQKSDAINWKRNSPHTRTGLWRPFDEARVHTGNRTHNADSIVV